MTPNTTGDNLVVTSIKLPQSLLSELDKLAESDYRTRSNLIQKILGDYVSQRVKA